MFSLCDSVLFIRCKGIFNACLCVYVCIYEYMYVCMYVCICMHVASERLKLIEKNYFM